MAKFFDKIGELAKTAADKTGDMIEQTRLNSKINAEEAAITKLKEQIGNYYWEKSLSGWEPEAGITGWLDGIQAAQQAIAATKAELTAMKPAAPSDPASAADSTVPCPACGKCNTPGTKFCSECGGKLP